MGWGYDGAEKILSALGGDDEEIVDYTQMRRDFDEAMMMYCRSDSGGTHKAGSY